MEEAVRLIGGSRETTLTKKRKRTEAVEMITTEGEKCKEAV